MVLEGWGALASGAAWLCCLASTLRSSWLTSSTPLLPAQSFQRGLWRTCVLQDPGPLQCRALGGALGLPAELGLARVLMCLALAAGLGGFLTALASTPLLRRSHAALRPAGAGLCLAAGILGTVPVSLVAHLAVRRYRDPSVPEVAPRWELGDALFWGWTAGVLHLLAAALLLLASSRRTGTASGTASGTFSGTASGTFSGTASGTAGHQHRCDPDGEQKV